MLLLVVFTGFAALAGNLKAPKPDNFSTFDGAGAACPEVYEEASGRAADFALALMQVLYSYSGWENANYVSKIPDGRSRCRVRCNSVHVFAKGGKTSPVLGLDRGSQRTRDTKNRGAACQLDSDDSVHLGKH